MTLAWKGLILAGGRGSRLHPMTQLFNKHMLPVYDKPMIYYPLSTLMLAGIRDIVLVSTPSALPQFESLLGDGGQWGLTIAYASQPEPNGIADGVRIAAPLLGGCNVALVLGDNIFFGSGLGRLLRAAVKSNEGASIFVYEVAHPDAFGTVVLDSKARPLSITEKAKNADSRLAVTGFYLYGPDLVDVALRLSPSARGELEITDVNRAYLDQGRLKVYRLGRGYAWLDGGTPNDLFEASQFIRVMEERTGLKIGCPEEIAFRMKFITLDMIEKLASSLPDGDYAQYLLALARSERARNLPAGEQVHAKR
jgi:glucose-1-phosphate thymidylyltransferase